MNQQDIITLRQKFAALAQGHETSHALRCYLDAAATRDPVDMLNELEVLASIAADQRQRGR